MEQWRDQLEKKQKAQKLVDLYKAKVSEHRFERAASKEMYGRLFEPITESIPPKLEKMQLAIEGIPPKVEAVQQAIEGIPPKVEAVQQAIEDTHKTDLEELFAPAIAPAKPTTANLDAGIDNDMLTKYGFLPVSEVFGQNAERWLDASEAANEEVKTLGREKARLGRAKKDISEVDRELKNLQEYRDRIRSLIKNKVVLGKGQRKRHAYKVSHGGKYGSLIIDLPALLGHHRLRAQRGGKLVLDAKADQDLVDLLTKRFNRQKNYSRLSQKLFRQLTDLSDLPVHQTSSKYSFLCDPHELVNQLELICGSIRAGNDSQVEKINGLGIIDKLLKLKIINNNTHEGLYRKYFE